MTRKSERDEEDARYRRTLIGMGVALALVVVGVWLLVGLRDSTLKLECYVAHHRNCDSLP